MKFLLTALFAISLHFSHAQSQDPWKGTWSIKDASSRYFTLNVGEKTGNGYACTLNVEGQGFFFLLNCIAMEKPGGLEVHFVDLNNGKLREPLRANQLLLSLDQKNNKIITNWKKWHTGEKNVDLVRS